MAHREEMGVEKLARFGNCVERARRAVRFMGGGSM